MQLYLNRRRRQVNVGCITKMNDQNPKTQIGMAALGPLILNSKITYQCVDGQGTRDMLMCREHQNVNYSI
jgi:hypothetical protein